MIKISRYTGNPILTPVSKHRWESEGTFNGSVVRDGEKYHMVYRALSAKESYLGENINLSTIGYTNGPDGKHFGEHSQLIIPENDWELYGCEDPRVTKFGNKYFIFYTALSSYPFTPPGIRIGVAVTSDFKKIEEKHPVTYFNSKAMALFPEKINGKIAAVLTVNTDLPPSKICIALFDSEEQIWSREFWGQWYSSLNQYLLPLQRSANDQVEVGAVPVKTKYGWLILYSYISNYTSQSKTFGIEAVLLDLNNPFTITGKTESSLLVPEKEYELYGNVSKVTFPSGAVINGDQLYMYYGASDTTCCLATLNINDLAAELLFKAHTGAGHQTQQKKRVALERFAGNPIIKPDPNHLWENKLAFNPAAIYENGKVHILYRAQGTDGVSVVGYATSVDGTTITERLPEPIYTPREDFEKKTTPGDSGCEDARITRLWDRFYMTYTAYDGKNPPRVALTTISVADFNNRKFNWDKPKLISPPGRDDKNTCVLPGMSEGRYIFLHRFNPCIWIDFKDDLNFGENNWLDGTILLRPRPESWDSEKIGIGAPPLMTADGWLLIYHGLSKHDWKYRLGAALLNKNHPEKVISRLEYPILEPETKYENRGLRPGTVFACGAVIILDKLYVYYGGADQFVGVASMKLQDLLDALNDS